MYAWQSPTSSSMNMSLSLIHCVRWTEVEVNTPSLYMLHPVPIGGWQTKHKAFCALLIGLIGATCKRAWIFRHSAKLLLLFDSIGQKVTKNSSSQIWAKTAVLSSMIRDFRSGPELLPRVTLHARTSGQNTSDATSRTIGICSSSCVLCT